MRLIRFILYLDLFFLRLSSPHFLRFFLHFSISSLVSPVETFIFNCLRFTGCLIFCGKQLTNHFASYQRYFPWGTPRGAGGIPSNINRPNDVIVFCEWSFPCKIFISTVSDCQLPVEKFSLACGIDVFPCNRGVDTLPKGFHTQREWSNINQ